MRMSKICSHTKMWLIPLFAITIAMGVKTNFSYDECPICLEDFFTGVEDEIDHLKEGEVPILVSAPCCHNFHKQCILESLGSGNKECPMCREKLEAENLQAFHVKPPDRFCNNRAEEIYIDLHNCYEKYEQDKRGYLTNESANHFFTVNPDKSMQRIPSTVPVKQKWKYQAIHLYDRLQNPATSRAAREWLRKCTEKYPDKGGNIIWYMGRIANYLGLEASEASWVSSQHNQIAERLFIARASKQARRPRRRRPLRG